MHLPSSWHCLFIGGGFFGRCSFRALPQCDGGRPAPPSRRSSHHSQREEKGEPAWGWRPGRIRPSRRAGRGVPQCPPPAAASAGASAGAGVGAGAVGAAAGAGIGTGVGAGEVEMEESLSDGADSSSSSRGAMFGFSRMATICVWARANGMDVRPVVLPHIWGFLGHVWRAQQWLLPCATQNSRGHQPGNKWIAMCKRKEEKKRSTHKQKTGSQPHMLQVLVKETERGSQVDRHTQTDT